MWILKHDEEYNALEVATILGIRKKQFVERELAGDNIKFRLKNPGILNSYLVAGSEIARYFIDNAERILQLSNETGKHRDNLEEEITMYWNKALRDDVEVPFSVPELNVTDNKKYLTSSGLISKYKGTIPVRERKRILGETLDQATYGRGIRIRYLVKNGRLHYHSDDVERLVGDSMVAKDLVYTSASGLRAIFKKMGFGTSVPVILNSVPEVREKYPNMVLKPTETEPVRFSTEPEDLNRMMEIVKQTSNKGKKRASRTHRKYI